MRRLSADYLHQDYQAKSVRFGKGSKFSRWHWGWCGNNGAVTHALAQSCDRDTVFRVCHSPLPRRCQRRPLLLSALNYLYAVFDHYYPARTGLNIKRVGDAKTYTHADQTRYFR